MIATDSDDNEIPTLGDSFWNNATMGSPLAKYFKCEKCKRNWGTKEGADCFWCQHRRGDTTHALLYKHVKDFESWACITTNDQGREETLRQIARGLYRRGVKVVALKKVKTDIGPFFFVVVDNAGGE